MSAICGSVHVTVVVFFLARYFAAYHELLEHCFLFMTLNVQSFWQQWSKNFIIDMAVHKNVKMVRLGEKVCYCLASPVMKQLLG